MISVTSRFTLFFGVFIALLAHSAYGASIGPRERARLFSIAEHVNQCPICDHQVESAAFELPCGHQYHPQCAQIMMEGRECSRCGYKLSSRVLEAYAPSGQNHRAQRDVPEHKDNRHDNDDSKREQRELAPTPARPDASVDSKRGGQEEYEECPICLSNKVSPGNGIIILPCKHKPFCVPCYTNFKKHNGVKCPICRTKITRAIPWEPSVRPPAKRVVVPSAPALEALQIEPDIEGNAHVEGARSARSRAVNHSMQGEGLPNAAVLAHRAIDPHALPEGGIVIPPFRQPAHNPVQPATHRAGDKKVTQAILLGMYALLKHQKHPLGGMVAHALQAGNLGGITRGFASGDLRQFFTSFGRGLAWYSMFSGADLIAGRVLHGTPLTATAVRAALPSAVRVSQMIGLGLIIREVVQRYNALSAAQRKKVLQYGALLLISGGGGGLVHNARQGHTPAQGIVYASSVARNALTQFLV